MSKRFSKSFRRRHPAGRGTTMYQMQQVLNKQYEKGKGQSRFKDKKKSGHAQYGKIYSKQSWIKHKSAISRFGHWLKNKEVKSFWAVNPEHVREFLKEQEALGKSYKTITSYQTAINHVFFGSGRSDHEKYSAHELGIEKKFERKNNLLNREDRPAIPTKYDVQVNLIRNTGLRRAEAEKVGTKSFYRLRDDYYVTCIGKGGRPRITKILDSGKESFRKEYSDYIIKVKSKEEIPTKKDEIQEVYRTQKELYTDKIPLKYGLHIYRADYAQNLHRELTKSLKYHHHGVQFEVNAYSGDIGLFHEISKNLGHNRVDTELMGAYLRD